MGTAIKGTEMPTNEPIQVSYYSDVLCIWAYAADIKLVELRRQFGDRIDISAHYISVFGNTQAKIGAGWGERGGFEAYGEHVRSIAAGMPHISVHPQIWTGHVPASSAGCHVFLKAAQLLEARGALNTAAATDGGRRASEELAWRMRLAFFRDRRDIASLDCQMAVAGEMGLDCAPILAAIHNGEAYAALCTDIENQERHGIKGSPTYILNDGRQILYGNVGYRIIEANIQELMERPGNRASWC